MAIARHKTRRRELREGRTLARRVQRGDRHAFELLYASYEGRLYRLCHRLTGDAERAGGLVEATFSRALATLPERPPPAFDVAAHLYGTARALAAERGRNGGTQHGEPLDGHWGEHGSEIARANRHLAPRQRMTLAMRDLEGRPDDEIAHALGTSGAAVPALVARARLRLRDELRLPAVVAGCRDRLPALSAYADGTLAAEERGPLEQHLATCPACRAALFALQEAALRYRDLPAPAPSGELSSRMATALGTVGLLAPRAATASAAAAATPSGGRQTAAAVAMAALVLLGAGVTIAARRDDHGSKPVRTTATHHPRPPAAAIPAANGGRVTLAPAHVVLRAPPELRHVREAAQRGGRSAVVHGRRVATHPRAFVQPVVQRPVTPASRSTSPVTSSPPASTSSGPQPLARPAQSKKPKRQAQIPVEILPSVTPAQPQSASDPPPPAADTAPSTDPSQPSQTTTT